MPRRPRRLPPRLDLDLLGADLREALRSLDRAIVDLAGGEGAPAGFDPATFVSPGAPRVRSVLVFLSARAARPPAEAREPDASEAEHVAVAAELLHVAILLHDAALGRQGGLRRRAARRLLTGAAGVLAGHHLSLRALELARQAAAPEVLADLLGTLREIAAAGALADSLRGRAATPEQAVELADGHDGAVFAFACRAGAWLGGAERGMVRALGRYGRHAGLAWAMAEDLADVDGEGGDERSGERLATRAAEGRQSIAVALAAERDPEVARLWEALSDDPAAGPALAARVRDAGGIDALRRRLVEESWSGRRALARVPESRYRDALDRIVAGLP